MGIERYQPIFASRSLDQKSLRTDSSQMSEPKVSRSADHGLSDFGQRLYDLSHHTWGHDRAIRLIGLSSAMREAELRLLRYAQADSPVLITGETGTGKELFARALSLLSRRREQAFLSVNCAQYQDSHLLASELFGHKKGSFTGAVNDRPGLFEDAHRGVVFLDEVGELHHTAQAMLLRVISEGELIRVGENRPRRVDVRIVAATARDVEGQVTSGTFREDLYYRLRFLRLRIPPLRERGNDWRLLLDHSLGSLNSRSDVAKRFSAEALQLFESYTWPGNVRELKSLVELAFLGGDGNIIDPCDFKNELRSTDNQPVTGNSAPTLATAPSSLRSTHHFYMRMRHGGESFWDVVYGPFMDRELNRQEVQAIVAAGLSDALGSYKRLLPLFGVDRDSYLKFMDFLRHHRLKPPSPYHTADRPFAEPSAVTKGRLDHGDST